MIKVMSFFSLPIPEQRIGRVYSLANSSPRGVHIDGVVHCLVPPREIVRDYKDGVISKDEYTARYRKHIVKNWSAVKKWLDSLADQDDMYLCCWERTGFCHRYLVAKLIKKFRPDLSIRVT